MDDYTMTMESKRVAQKIIKEYDLPLEVVELDGTAPVKIIGGIFDKTLGFLYPTMIIRPKHTHSVMVLVGRNTVGWWTVGQYWRYLKGCPDYYCVQYTKQAFQFLLMKTEVDSYLRFVPDQFRSYTTNCGGHILHRYDASAFTVVATPIIDSHNHPSYTRLDYDRPLYQTTIIVREDGHFVSPKKWRTQVTQLLNDLYSIPVMVDYLSLPDAISFAKNLVKKYKLPLKERRSGLEYHAHSLTIVSALSYGCGNETIILGSAKGYKEEFPVICVSDDIDDELVSVHLTTLGHLCGILFSNGLMAFCGGAPIMTYSLPTPQSCILTIEGYLADGDPVYDDPHDRKKIKVLSDGKVIRPKEWLEFAHTLKAELLYERIDRGSQG